MITTIKITKETRERLLSLEISEKDKTFDMIINDLITYYKTNQKDYKKDYANWKKDYSKYREDYSKYKKEVKETEEDKQMWKNLLKWAKSQGFKG